MSRIVILLTEDGISVETDGDAEFQILDFSDHTENKVAYHYTHEELEIKTKTPKQLNIYLRKR